MKAVIPNVPLDLLNTRRSWGADGWDEVWDGVLHMLPPPRRAHQELEADLLTWIRLHWAAAGHGKVFHQIAVSPLEENWTSQYRVPDLVLLTPDRYSIDQETYFCGAPSVAVELRSDEDEAYEKLGFYAKLGIPEVWIIDVETLAAELHVLSERHYRVQPAGDDGWLCSRATGIEFRRNSASIELRLTDNPSGPSES